ncbi:MAG: hypothetical protein HOV66_07815 [Streptomycetaceae bacterium]|nr:hypothetical protein [Streptomycetaceae bacterium]NUS54755.1 hypothetical protein [Streptomycetaceae bacterium]
MWDAETANRVQAMVEEATGRACPCFEGNRCPLLPVCLPDMVARQDDPSV